MSRRLQSVKRKPSSFSIDSIVV